MTKIHRPNAQGPKVHPDCDIAEMRWMKESKGKTVSEIFHHFEGVYTKSYISQICQYTVRASIQPKEPK